MCFGDKPDDGGNEEFMKQKKGSGFKMARKWTDENRIAKNRLGKSIKASITKGELDEEKIIQSVPKKENSNEN